VGLARLADSLAAQDVQALTTAVHQALERDGEFSVVLQVRHRTRGQRWVEDSGRLVHGARGQPLRMVGTLRDVTTQREAQALLAGEAVRRRATFENSAVGMAELALDGRWLHVNAQLCEITGYSREALMAMDFRLLTHPEDRRDEWPQLRQVLRGKLPFFRREKRYLRHDGSSIWVAASSAVVRDSNHRGLHSVTVVEDITERVHVAAELAQHRQHLEAEVAEVAERSQALQQALRARSEGEHFLRSIADNIPDMVGDWDASRVLRFASRPYRDWFAPGQDPVGRSRAEFFGAPDTDAGEQAFAAAIGRPCPAL